MSDQSGPPDTRPPSKPPTTPPPTKSGHLPPARRDLSSAAVGADAIATHGGPGFTLPESLGPPSFGTGAPWPSRPGGGSGPGGPTRPRFAEGEHRLVGHVGPPAEAEATVLASLIVAAATARKP